jgi:probable F420-dependent oxidoreductase
MRLSGFMFLTDVTIGPAELAIALEDRGFDGLWVPEHPHIPTRRLTPVPPAYGGGSLATFYLRLLDPFVALTAAAAATSTLRVGTGICLLALRDAVVTAKEVATLDHLSGGRFDFGVGYGWNADEFDDHGQRFDDRHAVVREKLELMRGLWGDEVASYQGVHVDMEPSWAWPKPLRGAELPVWLGGNGPTTMREAARWADWWYPTPSSAHLGDDIALFRSFVSDSGRDPATVHVGVAAAPADPDLLHSCLDWGVEELSIALPSAGRDDVLGALDRIAEIRETVLA